VPGSAPRSGSFRHTGSRARWRRRDPIQPLREAGRFLLEDPRYQGQHPPCPGSESTVPRARPGAAGGRPGRGATTTTKRPARFHSTQHSAVPLSCASCLPSTHPKGSGPATKGPACPRMQPAPRGVPAADCPGVTHGLDPQEPGCWACPGTTTADGRHRGPHRGSWLAARAYRLFCATGPALWAPDRARTSAAGGRQVCR
jgi:hypothetical protein